MIVLRMHRIQRLFYISLFTASTLGMLFSMAHYHNEAMECLYHVEDQHITENDLLCPVCGLVAIESSLPFLTIDQIVYPELLVDHTKTVILPQTFSHISQRGPPIMV